MELPVLLKEDMDDAARLFWDLGHRKEDLPVSPCLTQKTLLEMKEPDLDDSGTRK